ncbi:unnamed protein product [Calicophoron daubneyi]|uniref:Uncharacterized protein n=1 Tax=Calicophoron daubneyi TaxID=300641 RepID=A0AAV2TFY7_CALDB
MSTLTALLAINSHEIAGVCAFFQIVDELLRRIKIIRKVFEQSIRRMIQEQPRQCEWIITKMVIENLQDAVTQPLQRNHALRELSHWDEKAFINKYGGSIRKALTNLYMVLDMALAHLNSLTDQPSAECFEIDRQIPETENVDWIQGGPPKLELIRRLKGGRGLFLATRAKEILNFLVIGIARAVDQAERDSETLHSFLLAREYRSLQNRIRPGLRPIITIQISPLDQLFP